MPYEQVQKSAARSHTMNMENREKLSMSGVEDVTGFDENVVVLTTARGELSIRGSALHRERIDLDAGELELRGSIRELSYDEPRPASSLWQRLFG